MALDKWNGIPVFGDETPEREYMRAGVSYGLVPRDYSVDPVEMFAPPSDMEIYPQSEIEDRLKEQWELEQTLYHLWNQANGGNPGNLYQDGWGYCWTHSTVNATMMAREAAGMPFVPLSAFMVAAIIKDYRDQGGWCGQSAKFIAEVGVCSQELWPQEAVSKRLDTPDMRANAALHKITEEWRDLTRPIHGQVMTEAQSVACSINCQPGAEDFNWWGHSVCRAAHVVVEDGSIGKLILNSHQRDKPEWIVLRGRKADCDGAIAIRSVTASAA